MVRRRRRDFAVLKTLGFDRGQVRATVAWQATTLAALGVALGVPLGIVIGDAVWRLIADGRSAALLTSFFGDWLFLKNLKTMKPDATLFPEFDDNLREAFRRETELFLASQVREDRLAEQGRQHRPDGGFLVPSHDANREGNGKIISSNAHAR